MYVTVKQRRFFYVCTVLPLYHHKLIHIFAMNTSHHQSSLLKMLWITALLMILMMASAPVPGSNANATAAPKADTPAPRYIFLFIGDGMGPAHLKLGELLLPEKQTLAISSFPVIGMATTHASDRLITDSAAAGTALATGSKTTVGTISMAGNHLDTLRTIAEMAKARGMRTGIVSSVGIDDATPACFYAHNAKRGNLYDIAIQMTTSGFNYFGGGYAEGNLPANLAKAKVPQGDLDALMRSAGYVITGNREELHAVKPGMRCWAHTGHDSRAAMRHAMDRHADELELSDFTREGIRLLDNPRGFFMMVEGGKIDWAAHANDAAAVAGDVIAFDKAVQEAVAFYHRHPRQTLIIVTADHECGGLSLGNTANGYEIRPNLLRYQKISRQQLGEKVTAWKQHRTAVTFPMALDSLKSWYRLGDVTADAALALSDRDSINIKSAWNAVFAPEQTQRNGKESTEPFTAVTTGLLNTKAGIGWSSTAHTAIPVQVFAIGQGAEAFGGQYDNTDIAKKIIRLARLKTTAP